MVSILGCPVFIYMSYTAYFDVFCSDDNIILHFNPNILSNLLNKRSYGHALSTHQIQFSIPMSYWF